MTVNKLSKEELRNFYREEYAENFANRTEHLKRIIKLSKYFDLSESDIVADYACGNGSLLDVIYNKIKYYYGVDFSNEQIGYAKKRLSQKGINNGEFIAQDIIEFSKNNLAKFDKAFSFDFTEHIYDEELIDIFSAIRDTLKPQGKLFIHTPNGNYLLEILKNKNILHQIEQHIAVRNDREYVTLLQKIGFRKIQINYIAHYIPPMEYLHFLSKFPFIGKYFEARLFIICEK